MSTTTPVFRDVLADPRLARRAGVRFRMAERDAIVSRRREIENAVLALDSELDTATNAHQVTCEPIQLEIAELERERVVLMADRKPVPVAIDARRRELLAMLYDSNFELESAVTDHKTRTAVLQRAIQDVRQEESKYAALTEHSLAGVDYANPHWADLLWCSQNAVRFAEARVRAALEKVSTYESELRREQNPRGAVATVGSTSRNGATFASVDYGRIELYESRLRRWRLELATARKQQSDATREANAIRQKIIDE